MSTYLVITIGLGVCVGISFSATLAILLGIRLARKLWKGEL